MTKRCKCGTNGQRWERAIHDQSFDSLRQLPLIERFAQEALGHNSKAVHAAYAKRAEVPVPSLDQWERQMENKVVEVQFAPADPLKPGGQAKPAVGSGG